MFFGEGEWLGSAERVKNLLSRVKKKEMASWIVGVVLSKKQNTKTQVK